MILLIDIGNTHTHFGLGNRHRVLRQRNVQTEGWFSDATQKRVEQFTSKMKIEGACLCSVVPRATPACTEWLERRGIPFVELNATTLCHIGIDYPKPGTIGADRLANAAAAYARYQAPAVVVDFGTAVTFDVVNAAGNYAGGIIAPGLSAMTDYLHEKTALLPKIRIRETTARIGKSTREAMLIGAVHGYRGLIRALIGELKKELNTPKLPVIATGGYARLIARGLPEIISIEPNLTLEGLRLTWQGRRPTGPKTGELSLTTSEG
jgi:type III pantothenate kinase